MESKWNELIEHYFDSSEGCELEPVPFGLTNETRMACREGRRYIARFYNPHLKNADGMALEASMMSFLQRKQLSFQVPAFLPTLQSEPYAQMPDGTLGAMTAFLEGSAPALANPAQAYQLGLVAGELSAALGEFDDGQSAYKGKPFTGLYDLHPLADRQAVQRFMASPPFEMPEADARFYVYMRDIAAANIGKLDSLPKQWVHHDVLVFNLLAVEDRIQAVLDFDLLSLDVRFFEFAICLNHVLQMSDGSFEMAEAFIKGYSEHCKASKQELEQLRLLTQVYHLAVLHIYIGQHYAGKPIEPYFRYILQQLRTRDKWLADNEDRLARLLQAYLRD